MFNSINLKLCQLLQIGSENETILLNYNKNSDTKTKIGLTVF